jgi:PQQ-like domain
VTRAAPRGAGLAIVAGLAGLVIAAGGCGPKAVFGLSSDDNNPQAMSRALGVRRLPAHAQPLNATGHPMAFLVTGGTPRHLVAYDLTAGKVAWSVAAAVSSRVEIGGDYVVAREGAELVARGLADGQVRWKAPIAGTFVGAAADAERAYLVHRIGTDQHPTWLLAAFDGKTGALLWKAPSPGQLGAPAAQGGLVMTPFLTQWLSILDGATGKQLTRIRGLDEQISFVATTSDAAWFGSRRGVFRLDPLAASGAKAHSTYGSATVPQQLEKAGYGPDAFDPVQAGYSASDRVRILWRANPTGDGFQFDGGTVAVHYFRYVLGLDPAGHVRWAYSQPRSDLVASAHTGAALVAISQAGQLIALDPATGAVRSRAKVDTGGAPVLGATFDADGWAPKAAGEPASTTAALVTIARDRDARFEPVKVLAVSTLATLPGEQVTRDLIAMLGDARTSSRLRDTVAKVLSSRADPAGLPALVAALSIRADYLAGTEPIAVGTLARALAALGGKPLDDAARASAVDALVGQLRAPTTSIADARELALALAAVGGAHARTALRSYLLVYRADPELAGANKLVSAVVGALAAGDTEDRAVVRFVADDPRSQGPVAAEARTALAHPPAAHP